MEIVIAEVRRRKTLLSEVGSGTFGSKSLSSISTRENVRAYSINGSQERG